MVQMEYTDSEITLSNEEQSRILSRFPVNAELSLCNRLTGKVHADIYQVIPTGKQAYLWYTFHNDTNVAILITKTAGAYKLELTYACFTNEVAYGTILSGVYFTRSKNQKTYHQIFCIDDISYYKGEYVAYLPMFDKLSIISKMFGNGDIGNIKSLYNSIRVCMPIMTNNYNEAQGILNNLPYPVYGFKCLKINEDAHIGIIPSKIDEISNPSNKCVFLIRANLEPDSYTIYGKDLINNTNKLHRIGIALIPTYKDSIRMNTLFRRIRENNSIDAIEESEDEDDFENIDPNKFLLPNVEYKMSCSFSKICNRWIPEEVVSPDTELSFITKQQTFVFQNAQKMKFIKRPHYKDFRRRIHDDSNKEYINKYQQRRRPIFSVKS